MNKISMNEYLLFAILGLLLFLGAHLFSFLQVPRTLILSEVLIFSGLGLDFLKTLLLNQRPAAYRALTKNPYIFLPVWGLVIGCYLELTGKDLSKEFSLLSIILVLGGIMLCFAKLATQFVPLTSGSRLKKLEFWFFLLLIPGGTYFAFQAFLGSEDRFYYGAGFIVSFLFLVGMMVGHSKNPVSIKHVSSDFVERKNRGFIFIIIATGIYLFIAFTNNTTEGLPEMTLRILRGGFIFTFGKILADSIDRLNLSEKHPLPNLRMIPIAGVTVYNTLMFSGSENVFLIKLSGWVTGIGFGLLFIMMLVQSIRAVRLGG